MSVILDAIVGGRGNVAVGMLINWASTTVVGYSLAPFNSVTTGYFNGRVMSFGSLRYEMSDRDGRLPAIETTVLIQDDDRAIQILKTGVLAGKIKGSPVSIYLFSPAATSYAAEALFVGVVAKVGFPGAFVAAVTVRIDDDKLTRRGPDGGWAITRKNWPNAAADSFDKIAPVLYGTHDSSYSQATPGLLPTVCVDKLLFRYLVCARKAKTLTRVFANGTQVASSGYGGNASTYNDGAFEYVTVDGRNYSVIRFNTDRTTDVITCDALGYEATGEGSGALMTNPATQWANRMTNFVFGDTMTGNWASTSARIDAATLATAEAYYTSMAPTADMSSDHDAERRTGYEVIAKYLKSDRTRRMWWTRSGKLAQGRIKVERQPYTGIVLRWFKDSMGEFKLREDDFKAKTRILTRTLRSASQGAYLSTLEVVDASFDPAYGGIGEQQDAWDIELSEAK